MRVHEHDCTEKHNGSLEFCLSLNILYELRKKCEHIYRKDIYTYRTCTHVNMYRNVQKAASEHMVGLFDRKQTHNSRFNDLPTKCVSMNGGQCIVCTLKLVAFSDPSLEGHWFKVQEGSTSL